MTRVKTCAMDGPDDALGALAIAETAATSDATPDRSSITCWNMKSELPNSVDSLALISATESAEPKSRKYGFGRGVVAMSVQRRSGPACAAQTAENQIEELV